MNEFNCKKHKNAMAIETNSQILLCFKQSIKLHADNRENKTHSIISIAREQG
jgi:hypothetical protein